MGGSKPSQFWLKEPAATDRKWRVEDAGIHEREKHEFATSEAEQGSMIPGQARKPPNAVRAQTGRSKSAAKKAGKSKSTAGKSARRKASGSKSKGAARTTSRARKSTRSTKGGRKSTARRKSSAGTSARKRGKSRR